MRAVSILGVPFHALTEAEAVALLIRWLDEKRNHIVVTPNPEAVMQARRGADFGDALRAADLRLADGIGILLASRLLKGPPLPERVRGLDTCRALFAALSAAKRPTTAYFLGGAPGVAEAAKQAVEAAYPNLRVTGLCDGFLSEKKEKQVRDAIKTLKPDILLVCMGMPRQELWAARHRDLPARLTLCLGGTMDVLAGTVSLTPAWLRGLGLEWLHRLLRQPSRAKRMLDLPRFVAAVVKERFRGGEI